MAVVFFPGFSRGCQHIPHALSTLQVQPRVLSGYLQSSIFLEFKQPSTRKLALRASYTLHLSARAPFSAAFLPLSGIVMATIRFQSASKCSTSMVAPRGSNSGQLSGIPRCTTTRTPPPRIYAMHSRDEAEGTAWGPPEPYLYVLRGRFVPVCSTCTFCLETRSAVVW